MIDEIDIVPPHRACVFCGNKPTAKNKEHVIPKWIINRTGDNKRTFSWHAFGANGLEHKTNIPFDQFTFPACEQCNTKYASLESKAKIIFEKLEHAEKIQLNEVDVLLDWFDKLRVGVWLAFRYLNKEHFRDAPNFHIAMRIAKNDRFLAIYRREEDVTRCTALATNGPSFLYMPSAAGFVFNKLAFVTVSTDFLLAKDMGWPFPRSMELQSNGTLGIELREGTGRSKHPIRTFPLPGKCTKIFQPMIRNDLPKGLEFYDRNFIKEDCIDYAGGRGTPRVFSYSDTPISPNGDGFFDCIPPDSGYRGQEFAGKIGIAILSIQNQLWNSMVCSKDHKEHHRQFAKFRNLCKKFNEHQISAYKLSIERERKLQATSPYQNRLFR